MIREDQFEELFQGEGALPRPPAEEFSALLETWRRVRRGPVPLASEKLRGEAAQRVREEFLVEELFRGEGALDRVDAAEVDGVRAVLRCAAVLSAPKASPRVAAGVRRRLSVHRLRRRRIGLPVPRIAWPRSLGLGLWDSRVIRLLAGLLLLQALALPVVASVLQQRMNREAQRAKDRFLALESNLDGVPFLEPIRLEEVTASAAIDPDPAAPDSNREFVVLLQAENDLRLRWRAFLERQHPEVRLMRARRVGTPPAVHEFIRTQADRLAQEIAGLEEPLDLALSVRALVLAGNSERFGEHAGALREGLARLLARWESAPSEGRVAAAAAFAEHFLCTRGAHRAEAERAVNWLAGWVLSEPGLETQPAWVLAEAAQVLEWAPILLNRVAGRERELLEAELERRAALGGSTGEEAAAGLLRAFPLSPSREEQLRLTHFLRSRPDSFGTSEPWPLVHLAWGLFPPSGAWADFSAALRSAALSAAPANVRERALWLLALTVLFAEPEELGRR